MTALTDPGTIAVCVVAGCFGFGLTAGFAAFGFAVFGAGAFVSGWRTWTASVTRRIGGVRRSKNRSARSTGVRAASCCGISAAVDV
ncbi:hypothetical protein [Dactylosporangium sp. NPDC005555]|uniref:hypothetical protein n=1 Tax=Dactylosporangium sp. NPDC005555 TaxID=3154889 RepID=UPI0033B8DD4A